MGVMRLGLRGLSKSWWWCRGVGAGGGVGGGCCMAEKIWGGWVPFGEGF